MRCILILLQVRVRALLFVGEVAAFLMDLAHQVIMFLVEEKFVVYYLDTVLDQVSVGMIALVHKFRCKFLC